ncbi:MAG: N-acetyltransferase [Granulosicoccus sp.]|nr:N-acetyltransferase [Granulosicoccus sp.]
MKFSLFDNSNTQEVIQLFTDVFSTSEGEEEGNSIGELVANLIDWTPADDIIGFVALEEGGLIGSILFTRLIVPDAREAFILSPVAIATGVQGRGIGQKLIRFGIDHLKSQQVNFVFTYGNPDFYAKTGFRQVDAKVIKAPYPLSQPIGWLAQSLDGTPMQELSGSTQCVAAFSNPVYW